MAKKANSAIVKLMKNILVTFFISSRNLIADKIRFVITATGVGLAVALILLLRGIANGTLLQATSYFDKSSADLFMVQKGVANMYQNISILPRGTAEVIKDVPGVRQVIPMMFAGASYRTEKDELGHFFFTSLDLSSAEGKAWVIVGGRSWQVDDEMVIDRVMAKKMKIALGDRLRVRNLEFEVVGFTVGGANPLGSFVFVSEQGGEDILRLQNVANHFRIFVEPGIDHQEVIKRLKETIPDVEVYTHAQFRANHRKVVEDSVIPSINVMAMISFFVGVAVIGLTLYTSTVEKKREFGIIKAIGASNQNLYQIVFWQAIIAAFFGFWLGFLVTLLIRPVVRIFTPEVSIVLTLQLLTFVFWVANIMSIIAVLIPVKVINKIDPAIVFKE